MVVGKLGWLREISDDCGETRMVLGGVVWNGECFTNRAKALLALSTISMLSAIFALFALSALFTHSQHGRNKEIRWINRPYKRLHII